LLTLQKVVSEEKDFFMFLFLLEIFQEKFFLDELAIPINEAKDE
jgi:hypothetical protein